MAFKMTNYITHPCCAIYDFMIGDTSKCGDIYMHRTYFARILRSHGKFRRYSDLPSFNFSRLTEVYG